MHTYQIVIGDWSDDGHGKTATITVQTNLTAEAINKAYKKTSAATKVGLLSEGNRTALFEEYEDNAMSKDIAQLLKDYGVDMDLILSDKYEVYDYVEDDEEGNYHFEPEALAALYMEMAKASLPELTYKFLKDGQTLVRGLGYGLFH